jgi:hypothetical protein
MKINKRMGDFVFVPFRALRNISYLFFMMLGVLSLSYCEISQVPQTAVVPTYVLTPGESLVQLWGGKDGDYGSLEIYTGREISREEYVDQGGTTQKRESIRLRILYPELESYQVLNTRVHEGQVIEFGAYRLRVLDIRRHELGGDPIVEVAISDPGGPG